MPSRFQHRSELLAFLQREFPGQQWQISQSPAGRGHETYIARGGSRTFFIKLGAQLANYEALAALGVTPAVITTGCLADQTAILVQAHVTGRQPFLARLPRPPGEQVATVVHKTHHCAALQDILPGPAAPDYRDAGLWAMDRLREKWACYRLQLPQVAGYVDDQLDRLEREIQGFTGSGLVASHNDICNANWLIAEDGQIYLIDLEAMSQDDPAHDLGALLWWYYPPKLRPRFVATAGYKYDEDFKSRMRVRMALHCLDIILPRAQSFDRFDAGSFDQELRDFRAVVASRENPHGYDD
jgi:hypothetical protein